MRVSVVVGGAVLVVAAAGGVVGVVGTDGLGAPDPSGADPGPAAEATAQVRRGDLVETTSTSGALSYPGGRELATTLTGTITWLPAAGRVIREGQRLYEVDLTPVVRLDGKVPAWRDLEPGMSDGVDVRQLEQALADLGFPSSFDLEVDEEWTSATTEAVEEWQEDRDLEETGRLPLGTVIFTEGDQRVEARLLAVGDVAQPGTPVLEIGDDERQVIVGLDPTRRNLAPIGGEVALKFPDGTTARGRITDVEVVPPADDQAQETLTVTVEPTGRRSRKEVAAQLDGASVLVSFTDTLASDVLIVPVTALVALADGGHAVEVVDGSVTRMVPVTTGGFADATVAISGDVAEGDTVVVTP